VYFVLQDDPRHPLGVDLAVRGGLVAAALGWGMFARAQRRLVASLRERAARLEAEQRLRVQGARLTERTRIAREMHDVLAHRLSLVSLHAGALEVRTDASGEEVSAAAGVIRTSAHEALRELRTVIGVLRDTSANPLDGASDPVDGERPQPGLGDVPALVEAARAAGTPVDYACRLDGLDGATARTVYRTIQEGLTNARKHAPGAPVAVLVDAAPGGGIRVCLTNPAAPGGPAGAGVPGSGTGLVGLAERIALAGGRLEHGPAGDGFRLTVWLP
jgi:signal transduction histidine kinase